MSAAVSAAAAAAAADDDVPVLNHDYNGCVAQSGNVSWMPGLPTSLSTAMYQMSMGSLDRIVLVFASNW